MALRYIDQTIDSYKDSELQAALKMQSDILGTLKDSYKKLVKYES